MVALKFGNMKKLLSLLLIPEFKNYIKRTEILDAITSAINLPKVVTSSDTKA